MDFNLLYLDQNYASRICKYKLGQVDHTHFGELYRVLQTQNWLIPPSSFHVLELKGGYLLPSFKEVFEELSKGYCIRPWKDILTIQLREQTLYPEQCLMRIHSDFWNQPAELSIFQPIVSIPFEGSIQARIRVATQHITELLELPNTTSSSVPFITTLAKLLAFRSLNAERKPHDSDLADLIIAATVHPYASIFATDRFVREMLHRMGIGQGAYSGRRHEVLELIQEVQSQTSLSTMNTDHTT